MLIKALYYAESFGLDNGVVFVCGVLMANSVREGKSLYAIFWMLVAVAVSAYFLKGLR